MSTYVDPRAGKIQATAFIVIVAVVAGGIFLGLSFLPGDLYAGGWETQTEIWSVSQNGVEYTSDSKPEIVDQWGTSRVHYDTSEFTKGFYNEDLDPDYSGPPDIIIEAGNPYHSSYTGTEWVRDTTNEPYDTITKSFDTDNDGVDDKIVKWHHHVFMFEVDISTDADTKEAGASSYIEAKNTEVLTGSEGERAKVRVNILFDLNEWELSTGTVTEDGESYAYQSGWAGVMSATVYKNTPYYVSKEPPQYVIDGYAQEGSPLNMWTEDGERFYPKDGKALDQIEGVPNAVIMGQYVELLGGFEWPFGGSITPRDVGLLTTIRVDVITSENFILESGDQPTVTTREGNETGSNPIGDFVSWVAEGITAPFRAFADWMSQNWFSLIVGIVVIIAIIIVIIFIGLGLRAAVIKKIAGG